MLSFGLCTRADTHTHTYTNTNKHTTQQSKRTATKLTQTLTSTLTATATATAKNGYMIATTTTIMVRRDRARGGTGFRGVQRTF